MRFGGEESSHFSRFAYAALECRVSITADVEGRDPLTARGIKLRGSVTQALVDGYVRNVTLRELGSDIEYSIGGSNATFEIAAKAITFRLSDRGYGQLLRHSEALGDFIPHAVPDDTPLDDVWRRLDSAAAAASQEATEFVLECLGSSDQDVAREAALTLRALAGQISKRRTLQSRAEQQLCSATHSPDLATRIAAAEDLGYIGTSYSIPVLSQLLLDELEHEQVRWAAAIALSRIPDEAVVTSLAAAASTAHGGAALGTLLALSRWADERTQDLLEPVFLRFLGPTSESALKRYACLGLSRFHRLSSNTLDQLLDVFGDYSLEVDTRGFAALALSACLQSMDASDRARLQRLVDSFAQTVSTESLHPETIWSLEYSADLATLLEMNRAAARFYRLLADSFQDWRRQYYTALGHYEKGEASVAQGDADEGLQLFHKAFRALSGIHNVDSEESLTVNFRRDIVRARLLLQETTQAWAQSVDPDELRALGESMREVIGTYARYSGAMSESNSPKQLSRREADYIRSTRRLMDAVRLILLLDAGLRSESPDLNALTNAADNIFEVLEDIQDRAVDHLPRSSRNLLLEVLDRFRSLRVALEQPQLGPLHKLRTFRSLMSEVRGLFRTATWPMPARACPVGGLGRGRITVLHEDVRGDGTTVSPFQFPRDAPTVLNVLVHIEEMAPGASTKAVLVCRIGQTDIVEVMNVVEGPIRCSIVLPDLLPPVGSIKCTLSLEFRARDCNQLAASAEVYLRTWG